MRESETKEVLLDKLIGIQDIEAAKRIEEMDADLISECSEYVIELTGEELPSESALEQMKLRLLQRLLGQKGRVLKYRKGMLRKLLIAAIVVILIAAMAISMTPLGTNNESLIHRWGYILFHKDSGTRMDFGDFLTLVEGGKVEEFKSVRQFVRKTHMDILVPMELPKGVNIKKVQLAYDYIKDCPAVIFVTENPSRASIYVRIGKENGNLDYDRTEQIGSYTCGILLSTSSCQCEFSEDGNGYTIVAKSFEDARSIIENMKGSLEK